MVQDAWLEAKISVAVEGNLIVRISPTMKIFSFSYLRLEAICPTLRLGRSMSSIRVRISVAVDSAGRHAIRRNLLDLTRQARNTTRMFLNDRFCPALVDAGRSQIYRFGIDLTISNRSRESQMKHGRPRWSTSLSSAATPRRGRRVREPSAREGMMMMLERLVHRYSTSIYLQLSIDSRIHSRNCHSDTEA
jgi:hypothetical protein